VSDELGVSRCTGTYRHCSETEPLTGACPEPEHPGPGPCLYKEPFDVSDRWRRHTEHWPV